MEHRLAQTQTQRLMLTQRMQQAIQILQLNSVELEQYVQQELETNPVLEQEYSQEQREEKPEQESANHDDDEGRYEDNWDLDQYRKDWGADRERKSTGPDFSRNPDLASRRQHYEDSITKEESFHAMLMRQLRLSADEKLQRIGERILEEIDGKGYFVGSLDDVAQGLEISLEEAERGLRHVQSLEPTGVGARDVVECLLLQVAVEYPEEDQLKTLVSDHLEALERRQIPKIAKEMGVTPERVEELKNLLSTLDPWPGLEYSSGVPQYVTPDVTVEKIDGEYVVYLTRDGVPKLNVVSQYRKMAKEDNVNAEAKKYIREKVDSAKWLIRNIEQRQNTILRIGKAIVEVQEEFLDKGIEAIKPLTLQEIADKVGVHEATVSRATRGKYMQTPQGLFELKFFFSPGLRHDSGEAQSSKSVKSLVQKIIEEEDKNKPLSDQKIANKLKEDGINIARRTVTKYRESLGILSTNLRKQYSE